MWYVWCSTQNVSSSKIRASNWAVWKSSTDERKSHCAKQKHDKHYKNVHTAQLKVMQYLCWAFLLWCWLIVELRGHAYSACRKSLRTLSFLFSAKNKKRSFERVFQFLTPKKNINGSHFWHRYANIKKKLNYHLHLKTFRCERHQNWT